MKTWVKAILATSIVVVVGICMVALLSGIEVDNLTNDTDDAKAYDDYPVITPDGNYVVFVRDEPQGAGKLIYYIEAEYGANEEKIYDVAAMGYPISITDLVSTDNGDDYLVCFASNSKTFVLPILNVTSNPQPEIDLLPDSLTRFPYMSGDGRHVVFVKTIPKPTDEGTEQWQQDHWDIQYRDVNDNIDEIITTDEIWQESPTVSNNKNILFVEYLSKDILANNEEIVHWQILSSLSPDPIETDLQREFRIKPSGSPHNGNFLSTTYPMSSSNGKSVIYVSNWDLIIIEDLDSANSTKTVLVSDVNVLNYSISQNGKWIVYSAVDNSFGGYSSIYRIKADGTKNRKLTNVDLEVDHFNDDYPSISNNGRKITFTRHLDRNDSTNRLEREIFLIKIGALVDRL